MRCPFCKEDNDKVIDSRSSEAGRVIRRRRKCLQCQKRFTTYERIEESVKLIVIKKDGSRVPFDRNRIVAGVQKACYKRPISMQQIEQLAEELEEDVIRRHGQEVHSQFIGEQAMELLEKLDKVAFVRFASVYREFQDVGEFLSEVREVMQKPSPPQDQKGLFDS